MIDSSVIGVLPPHLTPHHLGCAVATLEAGLSTYADALMIKRRSRAFEVRSQGVSVCFLELRAGFYLELVAEDAGQLLARYLKTGFYHLCFLTDDLAATRDHLKERRFAALPSFASEAFAGHPCQFFVSPEFHLIEVAQISPAQFETFIAGNLVSPAGEDR